MESTKRKWLAELASDGAGRRMVASWAKDMAIAFLQAERTMSPERAGEGVESIFDAVGELFGLE